MKGQYYETPPPPYSATNSDTADSDPPERRDTKVTLSSTESATIPSESLSASQKKPGNHKPSCFCWCYCNMAASHPKPLRTIGYPVGYRQQEHTHLCRCYCRNNSAKVTIEALQESFASRTKRWLYMLEEMIIEPHVAIRNKHFSVRCEPGHPVLHRRRIRKTMPKPEHTSSCRCYCQTRTFIWPGAPTCIQEPPSQYRQERHTSKCRCCCTKEWSDNRWCY